MNGMTALREELPAVHGRAFLNYAATAPMTRAAADAVARTAREGMEPLADHFEEWLRQHEEARGALAGILGASAEEVAFTSNTSTALGLAAAMVPWRPGDRVVFPADEFPSNRFTWQNLAHLGVEAVAVPPDPGIPFEEQVEAMGDVRLVAVSHVSYMDGRRHALRRLSRICRGTGAYLCVDGIQAAGAVPVDFAADGADFYAGGAQKWLLGPLGAGYLAVGATRFEELHWPLAGWASARDPTEFTRERMDPADGARRLEPGLPDVAAVTGLHASLRVLEGAGIREVHRRVAGLAQRAADAFRDAGLAVLACGPRGEGSGIVAVRLDSEGEAHGLAAALDAGGVVVTARGRDVRVSPHAAASDGDLDRFAEALHAWARQARRSSAAATPSPRPAATSPSAASPPTRQDGSGAPRPAIVTGAGGGLGRALALALQGRGHPLLLLGRDAAQLEGTRRAVEQAGGSATLHYLDLGDAAAVTAWVEAHRDTLREAGVLVNNAAAAHAAPFPHTPWRLAETSLAVNALAPMRLAQAVLPGMLERGDGRILNVSSSGARCALPLFSVYAAGKGALWAWSEALGRELAGTGVEVCTFVPRHMDTATRTGLGRTALAHYRGRAPPVSSPHAEAERAVRAMERGHRRSLPRRTRIEVATNGVAPGLVDRRVARHWRGLGRP